MTKRTPAASARHKRRKGKAGELELCALLSDALGTAVKRHLGQAREGGCDTTIGPFVIECKRRARIGHVNDWMVQAQTASGPGEIPVVAMRADGRQWLVVFRINDAINLMRESLPKPEQVPWVDE